VQHHSGGEECLHVEEDVDLLLLDDSHSVYVRDEDEIKELIGILVRHGSGKREDSPHQSQVLSVDRLVIPPVGEESDLDRMRFRVCERSTPGMRQLGKKTLQEMGSGMVVEIVRDESDSKNGSHD
jgi:hypothetical protein